MKVGKSWEIKTRLGRVPEAGSIHLTEIFPKSLVKLIGHKPVARPAYI